MTRQPLLDAPPGFPRRAIPRSAGVQPWTTVEQLSGHEVKAWQKHDLVFGVQQDDRRRKGKTKVSKPSRHLGPSTLRTGIVFVSQHQQRAHVGLRTDEFRPPAQASFQVEIRPANRRRPCESRTAIRAKSCQKIPDRQSVALSFHQDVRPSRFTRHLGNPRPRRRSPSVVINSPNRSRPFVTASR